MCRDMANMMQLGLIAGEYEEYRYFNCLKQLKTLKQVNDAYMHKKNMNTQIFFVKLESKTSLETQKNLFLYKIKTLVPERKLTAYFMRLF